MGIGKPVGMTPKALVLEPNKRYHMVGPRMQLMMKARDAFLHEHAVDVGGGVLFWPSLAPLRRYERAAVRTELGLIPGRR